MGREIVYCAKCGHGLREDDFEKGRAQMLDHRPFCAGCTPRTETTEAPKPTAPQAPLFRTDTPRPRKVSTSRIPVTDGGPMGRRPALARPTKKPGTAILVGGIATALMVLIVMAVVLNRPRATSEAEKERKKERETAAPLPKQGPDPVAAPTTLRDLGRSADGNEIDKAARGPKLRRELQTDDRTDSQLTLIRDLIQEDTVFKKRAEVLLRIEAARKIAGPHAGELEQVRVDYDRKYEGASSRLAEFARTEAKRLASNNKLDDALQKCDDYLEVFGTTPPAEAIRKLREDLKKRRNP